MREDRKYEGEQKQGDGLEKWRDESETRDGEDRRLQIRCRGEKLQEGAGSCKDRSVDPHALTRTCKRAPAAEGMF